MCAQQMAGKDRERGHGAGKIREGSREGPELSCGAKALQTEQRKGEGAGSRPSRRSFELKMKPRALGGLGEKNLCGTLRRDLVRKAGRGRTVTGQGIREEFEFITERE